MKVINIKIDEKILYIDYVILEKSKKKNVNLNEIQDNSLYYTEKYVKRNKDKILNLLGNGNYDTTIYNSFSAYMSLSSILKFQNIKFIINKSLPFRVMEELLLNENIKLLECYFMPSDYVHLFAVKGVSIKFNNDFAFTTSFVGDNDLRNLKSIYYKKSINFYNVEDVKVNLESFLKVNESLKILHLYCYSNEIISFIVDKLNEHKLNVDIFIHQSDENMESITSSISFLKNVNKKFSKNKEREIKIIYSNEFFRNHIFSELTINGIKLCMVALLYFGAVCMIANKYHEYVGVLNLRMLQSTIRDSMIMDSIDDMDDEEVNPPLEQDPIVEETPTPEPPKEYVNYYANVPTSFDKLLSINSDVVGWLKVNNTKVNYPITKASDNQYYLNHDIYHKEIITGWVFMDYRNDAVNLDQNTVIFGHNLISGYMFGDLKNTTNKDWYTKEENQYITFNTIDQEMKWKIISMYRTDYTTDYLKTGFFNSNEFMNFINMIKERSIYSFNVNVNPEDKILTLSTCTGSNNRRLVIHAVLVK